MRALLLASLVVFAPAAVMADAAQARPSLSARDTATLLPKGGWSVGLFNPLRLGIHERVELQFHPLVAFASPNLLVRVAHLRGEFRLTGEYGLSLPTPAMRWSPPFGLGGYFFPSCKVAEDDASKDAFCQAPGWYLVPRAGLAVSTGDASQTTFRFDVAAGVRLTGNAGRPLDAQAPVSMLFAPVTNGLRLHASLRHDRPLLHWLRISAEASAYFVAPENDTHPLTFSAHLGADAAVGAHGRFTLGVIYWNSDQHAVRNERGSDGFILTERVRSHEVYPTIDFIWSS